MMNTMMKRFLGILFAVSMVLCNHTLLYAGEEAANAQAIWTEGNKTLTFYYGQQIAAGDIFNGETVTTVWSGTDVTDTGSALPAWQSSINSSVTAVIFDSSFAAVKPTSTYGWFYEGKTVETFDFSGLDTSRVTDMSFMFCNCTWVNYLDLSGFDTSKVTNMYGMFQDCMSLNYVDVSQFDTSQVTDMEKMFEGCFNVENLDVSSFDTSNVTDMEYMFDDCTSITSLDVSGFDTSEVTDMRNMFSNCFKLTSLDLSSFDISNVLYINDMFDMCNCLETIYCSDSATDWSGNFSKGVKLFTYCDVLTGRSDGIEVPYESGKSIINMAKSADLGGYFTPVSMRDNVSVYPEDAGVAELTIDHFLGSYMDMNPASIIPGMSNPELMDLYYDENGILTGYSRMSYGSTGTTFYFPYTEWEINGDRITLYYEEIDNPYYGADYTAGSHVFTRTEEGLLQTADNGFEHTWYRVEG